MRAGLHGLNMRIVMIWLARDQTIVVAESIWIRVLSLQPDSIRLSVATQSNLRIVRCQTGKMLTVCVTLAAVHENAAGLEVDAPGANIEQSCDELDVQAQMQTTWKSVFVTLRIGECVAFTETSVPAATPTESD